MNSDVTLPPGWAGRVVMTEIPVAVEPLEDGVPNTPAADSLIVDAGLSPAELQVVGIVRP